LVRSRSPLIALGFAAGGRSATTRLELKRLLSLGEVKAVRPAQEDDAIAEGHAVVKS
jgi:hypothetical protein